MADQFLFDIDIYVCVFLLSVEYVFIQISGHLIKIIFYFTICSFSFVANSQEIRGASPST